MKVKIIFIPLVLMLSSCMMTHISKKKPEKQASKETVEDMVVDSKAAISIMDIVSSDEGPRQNSPEISSFAALNNIRYNDKYEIYGSLNDQYDLYCEKYSKNKSSNLGIVDKKGNVILPHLFSKNYNSSNNDDVLLYMNNNYGMFNLNELRWVIPLEYEELNNLGNNLFSAKKYGKWGVISKDNVTIVPFEWSLISNNSNLENYITVTSNGYPNKLKGIYSLLERKLTIPCVYTSLSKLDRQNYFMVKNGSKYNIVDINNVPRFKKWYDEINIPSRARNYYVVKNESKFGVIDDSEKEIVPIEYLEFASYPFSDGSYLARNKDGKYGFILIDGRITLPFEYDNLTKKYNDNVVSVQNGKCGIVQVNAGVPYPIVTCNYDDIKGGNKTFIVEKGGKFGLLDLYGKIITPIEYQSLDALDENSNDGIIFKAQKNGHFQLINEEGKAVGDDFQDISPLVKTSGSYYYDTRFTYMKAQIKNGKYCVLDKVGKVISKPLFDDIVAENENILIVKSKGKYGLYSLMDQKQIVDYDYDLIIKTKDNYFGIDGKKIDFLVIKLGQVTKINTTK